MDTLSTPLDEKFRYFSPTHFPVSRARYTFWFVIGMIAALPEARSWAFRMAEPLVDKIVAASDCGFCDGYDFVADWFCSHDYTYSSWRR